MSKVLKIIGIVLAVLIAAIITVPLLFSNKVEAYGKELANDYIKDAKVDFKDFSLSVFSSFPDLQAGFDEVSVVGQGRFLNDTLLYVGKLRVDLNLFSALSGNIIVNGVLLEDVAANAIVAADSVANWDIVVNSGAADPEEVETDTVASVPLKLSLDKVELANICLTYIDSTSNIAAAVRGLDASIKGSMKGNVMTLDLNLDIDGICAALDGTQYLDGATVSFMADAVADLDSMKFVFNKNRLDFAGLPLAFDGWVQLKDSSTLIDMKLAAIENSFKTIFDLVPKEMLNAVDGMQTDGTMQLFVKAVGEYVDLEHIPALDAVLKINDGKVKYPDLPKSLNDINISIDVHNPGGSADLTTVNVSKMHVALGENPFDMTADAVTPISNLTFNFGLIGNVDLGSLKQALPLENVDIEGSVDADIKIGGDLNSINAGDFDKVSATGSLALSNFLFKGAGFSLPVQITNAKLAFTPKAMNLDPLDIVIGRSDISLTGAVENYLASALGKGSLTGSAKLLSKTLDCNQLLSLTSGGETTAAEQTPAASGDPIVLPKNIDFRFNTNISSLIYDKLFVEKVSGSIALVDGVAKLNGFSLGTCDGRISMNGSFVTPEKHNAKADMRIDMSGMNINKLVNSFSVIDSILPIAQSAYGNVNINLNVSTELDKELCPIMKSVNGNGGFSSKSIQLKDSDFQHMLSNLLNDEKYNDLTLIDCKSVFTIKDGNIVVEPFPIDIFGRKGSFGGSQGIDQTMNYLLTLPIERKEIISLVGQSALGGVISAEGDPLNVGIIIKGQLTKPSLKLDMSSALAALKESAKKAVSDKATKELDKAIDNIKDERAKNAVNKLKDGLGGILNKKKK